jgi:hypothetical protein
MGEELIRENSQFLIEGREIWLKAAILQVLL